MLRHGMTALMVLSFSLEIHEKNNIKHKVGNGETFVLGPS